MAGRLTYRSTGRRSEEMTPSEGSTSPVRTLLPNGGVAEVRLIPIPGRGPNGQVTRAGVFVSPSPDLPGTELSMSLSWLSRLRYGLSVTWPPETVDKLDTTQEGLRMAFRDPWYPFNRPFLPFNLDVPSLWSAIFCELHGHWVLRRVRHLDYDGEDLPP